VKLIDNKTGKIGELIGAPRPILLMEHIASVRQSLDERKVSGHR